MDPNTEIHNQESVNNKTHPSETNNMLNQENKVPISNSTQQLQETDDKEKVTTKITDQSHCAESLENTNLSQENKNVENIENKANKQPSLESKHVKNDPQVGQKSQISQVTPKGQESVVRKDSQAKSQKSLKDNQLSQPNTGRSEVISKDQANKAAKTKSQELKEKNTQAKNSKDQSNTKTNKDGKKQANSNIEKNQEPTLQNAIASIFSFFKATKDNIAESSNETATRLQEAVLKNPIVTKIRGTEYQSVISSDIFKKDQGKEAGNDPKKSQKSRVNRSQAKVPPKIETEKPKKVPTEVANATKSAKNIKSDTLKDKTSPSKENEKQLPRRAISKPKVKAEGSPGISPLKGKDEVEEQIRLHKIEEVKRMKKVLQDKIDALNDQLFELQKPALLSHHEETPTRVAFSLEQYKKEQKEEQTNKTKQAHDFAKKMIHERREMEQRREQRREKNQALVVKEIDVFYQKQLNELETLKGSGSAKAKFESNIKKFKEENMFASLEQKKNELKKIREFHKNPTASTTEENTVGDTNNEEGETKSKTKVYKKPLYKSPILEQVLREDAERKKQEEEKLQARKQLHKKLVEYGKEVKSTHLPQVHTAKYFDDDEKITRAIHRSTNMEKNLVRLAGKDGLYGYLDKMRNKYPDLAKPKESGTDSQDIGHSKKVKAKQQRHRDEDQEEEEGNYSGEDGDGHGHNYGLEEDWDLTERTDNHEEAPRDSHNKKQGIKNLKDQSYHPNRKSAAAQDNKTPDDSRVSEKSRQNHQKVGKKHQVEQKGVEAADEDNEWEEELKNDQDILKEKISSMLGDIKKMENQIKHKEEILLQDIERKKHANA